MKSIVLYLIIVCTILYSETITGPGSTSSDSESLFFFNPTTGEYSNYDNNVLLHHMNLDNVSNDINEKDVMIQHRAEAFLSNLIYDMNVNNQGFEYYYGQYKYAKLLYYEVNDVTGFNAGVFKTNTGQVIIAFGGTTASSEGTNTSHDKFADVITDMNLLNNRTIHPQYKNSIDFMHKAYEKIEEIESVETSFNRFRDVSITGHSLGGGLAQFTSLYSGFNAITFNTAPILINTETKKLLNISDDTTITNRAQNILNIMALDDPLTSILEGVEIYAQNSYAASQQESLRYKYIISPWFDLYAYISTTINYYNKTSIPNFSPSLLETFDKWVNLDKQLALLNDDLKESFGVDSNAVIFEMIRALKAKNLEDLVVIAMPMYGINDKSALTKLFYGERVLLSVETGHSMMNLIKSIYGEDAVNYSYYTLKVPTDTIFSDVSDKHMFFKPINLLALSGSINAAIGSKFYPAYDVTRAEFYKMISLYLLQDKWEKSSAHLWIKSTVPWQKIYANFIKEYISDKSGGVLDNQEIDDLFSETKLDNPITRSEAVAFIYMVILGNTDVGFTRFKSTKNYKECTIENDWEDVSVKVRGYGIVSGYHDGCFGSEDYLSRGQMAAILAKTGNWIERNYYEWEGLK